MSFKILHIDLSTRKYNILKLSESEVLINLAGLSLATYLIEKLNLIENPCLIIMNGLALPTNLPGSYASITIFIDKELNCLKIIRLPTSISKTMYINDYLGLIISGTLDKKQNVLINLKADEVKLVDEDFSNYYEIKLNENCLIINNEFITSLPCIKKLNIDKIFITKFDRELDFEIVNDYVFKFQELANLCPFTGFQSNFSLKQLVAKLVSNELLRIKDLSIFERLNYVNLCNHCPIKCGVELFGKLLDFENLLYIHDVVHTENLNELINSLSKLVENRMVSDFFALNKLFNMSILNFMFNVFDVYTLSSLVYTYVLYPQYFELNSDKLIELLYTLVLLNSLIICPFYLTRLIRYNSFGLIDLVGLLSTTLGRVYSINYVRSLLNNKLKKLLNIVTEVKKVKLDFEIPEIKLVYQELPKVNPSEIVIKTPIELLKYPVIQVALDPDIEFEKICEIALMAYKGGAKIIEIGTPIIKKFGIENTIRKIKSKLIEYCKNIGKEPDFVILVDTKTMDVSYLEAEMVFRNDGDIMTVMAIGNKDKIFEALYTAIKYDKAILIDFMQIPDVISEIEFMIKMLEKYRKYVILCIHRGITEQLKGKGIQSDLDLVKEVCKIAKNFKIAIAGGLKPGVLSKFRNLGISIFIVGAAIYSAKNPEEITRKLVEEISN